jgi:hypothetical protein
MDLVNELHYLFIYLFISLVLASDSFPSNTQSRVKSFSFLAQFCVAIIFDITCMFSHEEKVMSIKRSDVMTVKHFRY